VSLAVNPILPPDVNVRVFESRQGGQLEIRVICTTCSHAVSHYRKLEDVERDWQNHTCQATDRGGR
jgi:hypothetical protein